MISLVKCSECAYWHHVRYLIGPDSDRCLIFEEDIPDVDLDHYCGVFYPAPEETTQEKEAVLFKEGMMSSGKM